MDATIAPSIPLGNLYSTVLKRSIEILHGLKYLSFITFKLLTQARIVGATDVWFYIYVFVFIYE